MKLTVKCDFCEWKGQECWFPWPWWCPRCGSNTIDGGDIAAYFLICLPTGFLNWLFGKLLKATGRTGFRVPYEMNSREKVWRRVEKED